MTVFETIKHHKIVAILRGVDPAQTLAVAHALYLGGVRILEVTMNSADPLTVIEALDKEFGDKLLLGAGTVLDKKMTEEAVAAGARFILSPIVDAGVIERTKELGAVSIPGAYTATEIYQAYQMGGDIIKVFPALSADYIKNIAAPLPQIPLMPTGGIDAGNIASFKKAGAVGMGIGSALVSGSAIVSPEYLSNLTQKAQQLVSALNA